jgi:hypothetical protein
MLLVIPPISFQFESNLKTKMLLANSTLLNFRIEASFVEIGAQSNILPLKTIIDCVIERLFSPSSQI